MCYTEREKKKYIWTENVIFGGNPVFFQKIDCRDASPGNTLKMQTDDRLSSILRQTKVSAVRETTIKMRNTPPNGTMLHVIARAMKIVAPDKYQGILSACSGKSIQEVSKRVGELFGDEIAKVEQTPVCDGKLWFHAEIDILAMIRCCVVAPPEPAVDQTETVALLNQQLHDLYLKATSREAELMQENAERARQVLELQARDEALQAHIIAESERDGDVERRRKMPRRAV